MDDRRVDCRAFHNVLAFLGAFLALTTGIAGQQNTAASRSSTDIKQLLTDVRENQKQIDNLVDQYSCTETEEVHELDKSGQVKKSILKEYEVFYLGGQGVRREVKKDGRPLSPGDQKKEDGRVEKHIREYEKKHGEEGEDAARKKKEEADISTFLRVSKFTSPRRREFREHVVIVFDFAPNPDYKPQNKTEDLLHKLVGTLWVDDEARQVVRLEAHLSDTFKLGGGLLASVHKGGSMVFEQARTNEEVWLPSYVEAHFSARVLLFANAHGDYTSRFSDYKKFRVESVIVSLKNKK
ncbi:MAG: hypothetical protein WBO19_16560 [Terriglobia bacterium]